jgi:flagellin-like hook-associated protein FlgL
MKVEVGEGTILETTLQGTAVWGGGSATAKLSAGSGFTGEASVMGDYDGSRGNVRVTLEVINPGEPQDASYRVSYDGGVTFDDNAGLGYSLAELNTSGPLGAMGVQLNLADNATAFNAGDSVELQLIDSPHEDIFALFDELELALREVDDIGTVGALDYDGNGIADSVDLDNAIQAVVDANTRTAANPIQNPLVGDELEFFKKKARDDRFSEINNARLQNLLDRLDKALNQVSDQQSFVGLGLNKVESAESANLFLQEQVATTKSRIEDADFMESVSEMNLVETALQAATSTTSRVLQGISLLDYLR